MSRGKNLQEMENAVTKGAKPKACKHGRREL